MRIRMSVLVASLLLSSSALADDICVVIDDKADTLSEDARRGALAVARASFVKAGETLVDAPCENTYTLINSQLGETIFVTLRGPKGQRDAKAYTIDELGDLYQQMAESLVRDVPMGEAVTRHNVTSRQERRRRVTADSLYYVSLGPAYILGVSPDDVPIHLGGGYRYELDQFALELSAGGAFASGEARGGDQRSLNLQGGVAGYWFSDEEANSTPFVGVGLNFGIAALAEEQAAFAGTGLQAQISAGYEMLRASSLRVFVQFDTILPMYTLSHTDAVDAASKRDDRYSPVFLLKVGIGWAPKPSRTAERPSPIVLW